MAPRGLTTGGRPLVTNANEAAAAIIRRAIVRGDLLPGERLKETEIASELGISRTPVREAMLVLQTEGLLDLAPNRGATVRPYDSRELELLYDVRGLLEGYAARVASGRADADDLAQLRESCERMKGLDPDDAAAHNEENIVFHSQIIGIAGSARLRDMVKGLLEIPLPYKTGYWAIEANRARSLRHHRRIVEALRAEDPDGAEQAMRDHVEDSGRRIVGAQSPEPNV